MTPATPEQDAPPPTSPELVAVRRLLASSPYMNDPPGSFAADFADLGAPRTDVSGPLYEWMDHADKVTLQTVAARLARLVNTVPPAPDTSTLWRHGNPSMQQDIRAAIKDVLDSHTSDPEDAADEVMVVLDAMPATMIPEVAVHRVDALMQRVRSHDGPVHPARIVDDLLDLRNAIGGR